MKSVTYSNAKYKNYSNKSQATVCFYHFMFKLNQVKEYNWNILNYKKLTRESLSLM